jgi:uncharacterized membrane protein
MIFHNSEFLNVLVLIISLISKVAVLFILHFSDHDSYTIAHSDSPGNTKNVFTYNYMINYLTAY